MSIEDTQSEIVGEFQNLVGLYYNGLTANGFDLKESCESFWEFAEQFSEAYDIDDETDDGHGESYTQCEEILNEMKYCVQEIKEFIGEDGLIEDWKNPIVPSWNDMDIVALVVYNSLSKMNSCQSSYWSYSHITFDKEQVECNGSLTINGEFPIDELKQHIDTLFTTMEGVLITSGGWNQISCGTIAKCYESADQTYHHSCYVTIEQMLIHKGWMITIQVY